MRKYYFRFEDSHLDFYKVSSSVVSFHSMLPIVSMVSIPYINKRNTNFVLSDKKVYEQKTSSP